MKKLYSLGGLVASLIVASAASAAPVGNPVEGHELKFDDSYFSIGIGADFVTDRKVDDGTDLEMMTYETKITYALSEISEIYLTLGINEIENEGIDSDSDFIWGLGATFALYEWDNGINLGADLKYRASETDFDSVDVDYQDWQIALAVSKHYDWGCPYIGVKYSDFELSASGVGDANSDDVVGIFVGLDGTFTEDLTYTVEGRFIDEEAVFISLDYAL